jgi:hypothetical protein
MTHYDMRIMYIPGEDNTVADALSQVLEGTLPGKDGDFFLSSIISSCHKLHVTIANRNVCLNF